MKSQKTKPLSKPQAKKTMPSGTSKSVGAAVTQVSYDSITPYLSCMVNPTKDSPFIQFPSTSTVRASTLFNSVSAILTPYNDPVTGYSVRGFFIPSLLAPCVQQTTSSSVASAPVVIFTQQFPITGRTDLSTKGGILTGTGLLPIAGIYNNLLGKSLLMPMTVNGTTRLMNVGPDGSYVDHALVTWAAGGQICLALGFSSTISTTSVSFSYEYSTDGITWTSSTHSFPCVAGVTSNNFGIVAGTTYNYARLVFTGVTAAAGLPAGFITSLDITYDMSVGSTYAPVDLINIIPAPSAPDLIGIIHQWRLLGFVANLHFTGDELHNQGTALCDNISDPQGLDAAWRSISMIQKSPYKYSGAAKTGIHWTWLPYAIDDLNFTDLGTNVLNTNICSFSIEGLDATAQFELTINMVFQFTHNSATFSQQDIFMDPPMIAAILNAVACYPAVQANGTHTERIKKMIDWANRNKDSIMRMGKLGAKALATLATILA
jgi:hypothetical protein